MSTMTFRLDNGELKLVNDKINKAMEEVKKTNTKHTKKVSKFSDNFALSVAPMGFALGNIVAEASGAGVFWDTFMKYIFPWLIDIAKVYCVIKIAQGFYEEKVGGRDGGSGFGNFVTYGKWLLLFHLVPFFVLLIDQLGLKMVNDLKMNPINK